MKRFALLAAFALALPLVAVAQDKPAPKEHTMSGCLAKSGDGFVVNNTAEKGPKVIGLVTVAKEVNLTPHVGHKIDITGTAIPNKEAESRKPVPAKADHYMNITAIKMVSAQCP